MNPWDKLRAELPPGVVIVDEVPSVHVQAAPVGALTIGDLLRAVEVLRQNRVQPIQIPGTEVCLYMAHVDDRVFAVRSAAPIGRPMRLPRRLRAARGWEHSEVVRLVAWDAEMRCQISGWHGDLCRRIRASVVRALVRRGLDPLVASCTPRPRRLESVRAYTLRLERYGLGLDLAAQWRSGRDWRTA